MWWITLLILTVVQFVRLHSALGDSLTLPPKRILATTFVPSAWVDDFLIAERKAGLTSYINKLLAISDYSAGTLLQKFLTTSTYHVSVEVSLEDALPSSLTRTAVLKMQERLTTTATTPIAASYYPDWVDDTMLPESLDYSKFDIIFFGEVYVSAFENFC